MAEFRLKPKKQKADEQQVADVEPTTMIGHVASAAHALGSALSFPSRVTHGTINYLTGGEGGFGNTSLLDSTGGIEASRHLVRAGLLPENDPNHWEWSDLARGGADLVGDPTSWLSIGALTKAGQGLAKEGKLATGLIPQLAAGERALIGVRSPLGHVLGDIGTGHATADTLTGIGKAIADQPVAKAVAKSAPVQAAKHVGRVVRGLMDYRYEGTTHPDVQKFMPGRDAARRAGETKLQKQTIRLTREIAPADAKAIAAGARVTPSQQVHMAIEGVGPAPAGFEHHVTELRDSYAKALNEEKKYGTGFPEGLHDPLEFDEHGNPTLTLEYAARHANPKIGSKVNLVGSANASKPVRRLEVLKGNKQGTYGPGGVNDVLQDVAQFAHSPAIQAIPKKERLERVTQYVTSNHGHNVLDEYAHPDLAGKRRHQDIAKWVLKHPEFQTERLFVNAPMADYGISQTASLNRANNARTVADILAHHLSPHGTKGATDTITLRSALSKNGLRYRKREMAEQIASRLGMTPANPNDPQSWTTMLNGLLDEHVDANMVREMGFMKPMKQLSPPAEEVKKWWQTLGNIWKSNILAFPASRVRDLAGGTAQNVLHKSASRQAYDEAARLMTGQPLTKDYSHVPELQAWFRDKGLDINNPLHNTRANQDEGMRQLAAVYLPREHGFLGDIGLGQPGFTNADVLRNVPGQIPSTLSEQFVGAPVAALRNASLSDWLKPWAVRGVGGRTVSEFPPVKASEIFSESSDKLNRGGGWIHQMLDNANAETAAKNVNDWQVNYDPSTFTQTERAIKNYAPFYSFYSRSLPTTGKQLLDPGSPMSQLIKAEDRAYGGDPHVPDYVLDSNGIPLGRSDDGTLRYLTGFGLMHEPAARTFGQVLTAPQNPAPLMLNALSQLNPFIASPIEQATGVSFSREGAPLEGLESNSGRLLSNIGEIAGLREKGLGPVKYSGQKTVDFLAGLTPAGRLLSQGRMLTDTRRGPGKLLTQEEPIEPVQAATDLIYGALPVASGVRVTDISPQKQLFTLRKRAEEVAKQSGAKQREEVYFPKEQLERLREVDPEAAAKQELLQRYINSLKLKKPAKPEDDKATTGPFRLKAK